MTIFWRRAKHTLFMRPGSAFVQGFGDFSALIREYFFLPQIAVNMCKNLISTIFLRKNTRINTNAFAHLVFYSIMRHICKTSSVNSKLIRWERFLASKIIQNGWNAKLLYSLKLLPEKEYNLKHNNKDLFTKSTIFFSF